MDILRLSLILSIISLLILATISVFIEPPETSISSINPSDLGKPVKIIGKIVEDSQYSTVRILKISDGSEIIVPIFFELQNEIQEGDTVSISGKVQLYNEQLEVIPSNPGDIRITET